MGRPGGSTVTGVSRLGRKGGVDILGEETETPIRPRRTIPRKKRTTKNNARPGKNTKKGTKKSTKKKTTYKPI